LCSYDGRDAKSKNPKIQKSKNPKIQKSKNPKIQTPPSEVRWLKKQNLVVTQTKTLRHENGADGYCPGVLREPSKIQNPTMQQWNNGTMEKPRNDERAGR
jgi:hypothetical protein